MIEHLVAHPPEVSGARERPAGMKFCRKYGTAGNATDESTQDASAPDEQAFGGVGRDAAGMDRHSCRNYRGQPLEIGVDFWIFFS
jgi:hypothetical protein